MEVNKVIVIVNRTPPSVRTIISFQIQFKAMPEEQILLGRYFAAIALSVGAATGSFRSPCSFPSRICIGVLGARDYAQLDQWEHYLYLVILSWHFFSRTIENETPRKFVMSSYMQVPFADRSCNHTPQDDAFTPSLSTVIAFSQLWAR